jgi:hypothetical protein
VNPVAELCVSLTVAGVFLGLAVLTGSKVVVIVVAGALGAFFLFPRVLNWLDRRRSQRSDDPA